jgi:hypothetical protein
MEDTVALNEDRPFKALLWGQSEWDERQNTNRG